MRSVRPAVLLVAVVLLTAGCTSGEEAAGPAPSAVPVPSLDEEAGPSPTPMPTRTRGPTGDEELEAVREVVAGPFESACGVVDDRLCEDQNANGWPDEVEVAAGHDPTGDQCLVTDCPGATIDELLLSLQDNTLFILDASGSMAGDAGGGQTKMAAAKEALVAYAHGSPEFADLGLMVYGHRGDNSDAGRAESCAGIEVLAEVGEFEADSAEAALAVFEATGWTPIGASLDAAGPVLQRAVEADVADGVEGAVNRIILISDGIETCEGDPVASARALVDLGIEVVVDVVGFDLADADRAALQQVADVTGGRYADAGTGQALRDVLAEYQRQIFDAVEPIRCQRQALARYSSCRNELAGDMLAEFSARSREAVQEGRSAEAHFWTEWYGVLVERHEAETVRRQQQLDETLQRFIDEVDAARQRRDALQAGGTASKVAAAEAAFECPFDEAPEVV